MAVVSAVRRQVFAAALLAPSIGWAGVPMLSQEEQARMDRVLLKYLTDEKLICVAGGDFDCYVALQGRAPSQAYLDSIGAPTGRLRPWPEAAKVRADPKKNVIGSGHNALQVNIGAFSMIGQDTAHATVSQQCGPALCGSIATATLKKSAEGWTVIAFKTDIMQ